MIFYKTTYDCKTNGRKKIFFLFFTTFIFDKFLVRQFVEVIYEK